jgi:hypothetical protein
MPRMIDQVRASKLPSNMMQFAARGALQVPPAENIEILVHLAKHNKVFGDLARMTLAGWDEKSCTAVASDPQTPREVLEYFVSPDNLRPAILPALLENPSVAEGAIAKLAVSAMRETLDIMLKSERVHSLRSVIDALKANPYLKKEEVSQLQGTPKPAPVEAAPAPALPSPENHETGSAETIPPTVELTASDDTPSDPEHEAAVSAYMTEHAGEISAEGHKPFQAIGGIVDMSNHDGQDAPATEIPHSDTAAPAAATATAARPAAQKKPVPDVKRMNTVQKINSLDVKGRIQLALKGNKEERSILIRDGTKVVALAVLEAPKLSDGEVEKFASQKNVLEAVLRQIPLKRRFMKNYIVVRNLVANPRTPLDLSLGLMKNLLAPDLKNLSSNKEVSEMIRKLAMKMYKQKMEAANKK